jgi:hypothetical protein
VSSDVAFVQGGSVVSAIVLGEHDSFDFVQGGSSTMHLVLQHSMSLQPDSVIV